jgi:tetratricopeptide (TPR) repeat protein
VCLRNLCLFALASFAAQAQRAAWTEAMSEGRSLQNQGRFREAADLFQNALQEAERPPRSPARQAAALYQLATVNADLGSVEKAARHAQRAASILTKNVGADDPLLQTVRTELAELYINSRQYSTAESLLKQIVATQSRASQTASLPGARALDALACVYGMQKKRAAAEKLERQALSFLETLQGSGELSLAIVSLHLAMILDSMKRPAEALPYAERAAELLKQLPDPHPYLEAEVAMALASLYVSIGRRNEAEPKARQAVELVERVYGPDHPYTAWIWLSRAAVLRRLDRKYEAAAAQKQGQRILADRGQSDRLGDTVPFNALVPVR